MPAPTISARFLRWRGASANGMGGRAGLAAERQHEGMDIALVAPAALDESEFVHDPRPQRSRGQ